MTGWRRGADSDADLNSAYFSRKSALKIRMAIKVKRCCWRVTVDFKGFILKDSGYNLKLIRQNLFIVFNDFFKNIFWSWLSPFSLKPLTYSNRQQPHLWSLAPSKQLFARTMPNCKNQFVFRDEQNLLCEGQPNFFHFRVPLKPAQLVYGRRKIFCRIAYFIQT